MNDGNEAFRDDKYFVYFHLCIFKLKVKVNIRDLGVTSLVTEREFNVTWGIDQQIEKRKNFNYFERIRHHFLSIVILCRGKLNLYVYISTKPEFNKYFTGKKLSKYCNHAGVSSK